MIIALLIFFSVTCQSVICLSMSTVALTQDNDAVIRSMTSDLLWPIGIFDATARNNRPQVNFEIHVLTDRCNRSIGKLDFTARSRLIWQNDWRGLTRDDQTQRTFHWSGIKRIIVSVARRRDRFVFANAIRSVRCLVALQSVRFRMLPCRFRASVIQFDGSVHSAGEEIPASKLPELCANFTAKIGEIFRQLERFILKQEVRLYSCVPRDLKRIVIRDLN